MLLAASQMSHSFNQAIHSIYLDVEKHNLVGGGRVVVGQAERDRPKPRAIVDIATIRRPLLRRNNLPTIVIKYELEAMKCRREALNRILSRCDVSSANLVVLVADFHVNITVAASNNLCVCLKQYEVSTTSPDLVLELDVVAKMHNVLVEAHLVECCIA